MKSTSTFGLTLTLVCTALVLGGCASTLPTTLDDETAAETGTAPPPLAGAPRKALQQRSLGVRTGSTPSFYADTPGRRTFGVLGVIAMMREGNRLVENYGLEDPAAHLSNELVVSLATRNGMRTSVQEAADVLLNVKTINWDFRPYRNDPNALYVVYAARVSLVDRRAGTVLASGKCRSRRDGEGDSATLEQLLADGARRLHSELREAAHECAQRMKEGSLSAFLDNGPAVAQRPRLPEQGVTTR